MLNQNTTRPAIECRNVWKIFGDRADEALQAVKSRGLSKEQVHDEFDCVVGVADASFHADEGEIFCIMGLSGSGKSTLVRHINRLIEPTAGEILIGKEDINALNAEQLRQIRAEKIGMVFQHTALLPHRTVRENVALGMELRGVDEEVRLSIAEEKLALVQLSGWEDRLPSELSGGMQQRVGLARAFTMDSDILLMDEPFSALDPLIRSQLQDELIELQQRLNKTILFVSHDLDEALKIGTNIAIMESAQIIQHGKPEEIVLNPSNAYVEDFVAHTNPLNVLRGRSLMTQVGELDTLEEMLVLNQNDKTCVRTDDSGQVVAASRLGEPLPLHQWQEGEAVDNLPEDTLVMASPDISMRDAIGIRYRTGQPVLLKEDESLVGILSDRDFYHALLGKHFSASAA